MDRARFQLIRDLFHEADGLPAPERDDHLRQRCGGDTALLDAVRGLLDETDDGAAGQTLALQAGTAQAALSALDVPERVGPYRIVGLLGEGGMGVVHEAEQDEPRRRVALKLVRPGLLHEDAGRRLRDEAAILARLTHPGIAQVHQAGSTDDGRPWIAMELVRGLPLDEHVRRHAPHRRQRLALLVALCDAVAHAHRHGVVHRDLKAANVLVVADEGDPAASRSVKVLDFGIARLTDADVNATRLTHHGELVGTLATMSPEQVRGDLSAIDTRSDVWALGVLAYTLLADRAPLDLGDAHVATAARRIVEDEPVPLGRLDRTLRGDLEAVVAKALEKDPDRRYDTAAALGADLTRVLRHEPVSARRLTTLGQLGKLTRRHRALTAGLGLALGGLGLGLVLALRAADRAERARGLAEVEARTAESVTRFMVESFEQADPRLSLRRDLSVRDALDVARARVQGLPAEARAAVLGSFARIYAGVGAYDAAESLARQAVEAAEALGDEARANQARRTLAGTLVLAERPDEAEAVWARVLGPLDEAALDAGSFTLADRDVAELDGWRRRADGLVRRGQLDRAEALLAAVDAALAHRPERDGADLARTLLESRAGLADRRGRWREAADLWNAALRAAESDGRDALTLADARAQLAATLARAGDLQTPVQLLEESLQATRAVLGNDHPLVAARRTALGNRLHERGDRDAALAQHERALSDLRRRLGDGHPALAGVLNNLAMVHLHGGDAGRAEELLDEAVRLTPASSRPVDRATWQHNRADARAARGRADEAALDLLDSLELLLDTVGADHPHVATTRNSLAGLLLDGGRPDDAIPLLEDVLAWRRDHLGAEHPETIQALGNLGWLLHAAGRSDEAVPLLREALAGDRAARGDEHPATAQTWRNLGLALLSAGAFEEAYAAFTDATVSTRAALGPDHPETRALEAWLTSNRVTDD